jgi:uncharacterized small protein (DUF1192 family)
MKILDKTINVEREKRKQECVARGRTLQLYSPALRLTHRFLFLRSSLARYAAEVLRKKIEADAARIKAMEEERQRLQRERQENAKRILWVHACLCVFVCVGPKECLHLNPLDCVLCCVAM